jgi:hypothetical protein
MFTAALVWAVALVSGEVERASQAIVHKPSSRNLQSTHFWPSRQQAASHAVAFAMRAALMSLPSPEVTQSSHRQLQTFDMGALCTTPGLLTMMFNMGANASQAGMLVGLEDCVCASPSTLTMQVMQDMGATGAAQAAAFGAFCAVPQCHAYLSNAVGFTGNDPSMRCVTGQASVTCICADTSVLTTMSGDNSNLAPLLATPQCLDFMGQTLAGSQLPPSAPCPTGSTTCDSIPSSCLPCLPYAHCAFAPPTDASSCLNVAACPNPPATCDDVRANAAAGGCAAACTAQEIAALLAPLGMACPGVSGASALAPPPSSTAPPPSPPPDPSACASVPSHCQTSCAQYVVCGNFTLPSSASVPPPAPPSGAGWVLGPESASCDTACSARGLACDLSTSNTADSATSIAAAAAAAGRPCNSSIGDTVGWAYPGNPGICTHAGCCGPGGPCTGICAYGAHPDRSCSATHGHYSPLCYCTSPSPPPPPPPSPPPLPPFVPPGGLHLFLLHDNYGCASQGANLGTSHATPADCAAAAMADGRCHSLGTIMFSHAYNYAWGCRCCTTSDRHFNSNANWDVYQVLNAPPIAPQPPTAPPLIEVPVVLVHAGYGCASQAVHLGTTHPTAGSCAYAALQEPTCHHLGTLMFSHSYNHAWGYMAAPIRSFAGCCLLLAAVGRCGCCRVLAAAADCARCCCCCCRGSERRFGPLPWQLPLLHDTRARIGQLQLGLVPSDTPASSATRCTAIRADDCGMGAGARERELRHGMLCAWAGV